MFKSMKTGVLAAILISTAIYAHAQKKITEGTISYAVEYAPTPEQEPAVKMLPKELKVKFNGSITKIEMEQGPATIVILSDVISYAGLVLIDVPVAQMQFAVKRTKADYDKEKATAPKFSDFKATGEKKMIGSYNAEKYTYKDDKGGTYELWTTTDIELPTGFNGEDFKDIKGSLVKFTHFQQGMKQTLTVKEIKEEKNGPYKLHVPSGYEVKTMEEIMAMQGGGE
ncbi:hypothetical protein EZ428_14365 [Pedobacter frigiditerrae]|uniref:DUF4412 domain-containing protein n=1 Tax=Pedobacter frigiditerrae TaxID=2530452 RepID=A0A4R0MTR3_9SPHI|nr:hypothetical protein [Pedobacter frigiditerrae]TCC90455.1 hypothetical protein EZ428_14365 [Pedobacter frigiditerrae]